MCSFRHGAGWGTEATRAAETLTGAELCPGVRASKAQEQQQQQQGMNVKWGKERIWVLWDIPMRTEPQTLTRVHKGILQAQPVVQLPGAGT